MPVEKTTSPIVDCGVHYVDVMLQITDYVMRFAPIAVFAAVAAIVLCVIGAAAFFFLPVLLAYGASLKFECNPILAMTLAGVLLLGEQMSTARWVGFGIVWLALVVLTVDSLRAARRTRRAARLAAAPV